MDKNVVCTKRNISYITTVIRSTDG